jgi:hypothetical protein
MGSCVAGERGGSDAGGAGAGVYSVFVSADDEGSRCDGGGEDAGVSLGVAGSVAGARVVAVALSPGSEATEVELSVVVGVSGGPEVPVVFSAVPVADSLGVPLDDGVGDGVAYGEVGVVVGRGTGPRGRSRSGACGSRNRPTLIPAAARTLLAAFCAARIRRRTRTPSRRLFCCAGSKGVCSWASRIIRANSRSN